MGDNDRKKEKSYNEDSFNSRPANAGRELRQKALPIREEYRKAGRRQQKQINNLLSESGDRITGYLKKIYEDRHQSGRRQK